MSVIDGLGNATTESTSEVFGRASTLRQAFDASFAAPATERADDEVEILAITVGAVQFGVHLEEILAAVADKPITSIPSPSATLLGLAGFRGTIVSVHDLAMVLGEPRSRQPRWIVLCAADPSIALAFDQFDGHLRVDRASLAVPAALEHSAGAEVLRNADTSLPIVSIAACLATIGGRSAPDRDASTDSSSSNGIRSPRP